MLRLLMCGQQSLAFGGEPSLDEEQVVKLGPGDFPNFRADPTDQTQPLHLQQPVGCLLKGYNLTSGPPERLKNRDAGSDLLQECEKG